MLPLVALTCAASPSRLDTDTDAIVIGAGVSGMSAASALVRAGLSVRVLEATNRTGGRMRAYTFGDPTVYVNNRVPRMLANGLRAAFDDA